MSRLYLKIFVLFCGTLLLVEAALFAAVHLLAAEDESGRIERLARGQANLMREVLRASDSDPASLQRAVDVVGFAYDASVRLVDGRSDRELARTTGHESFEAPRRPLREVHPGVRIARTPGGFAGSIDIDLESGPARLEIRVPERRGPIGGGFLLFAIGLGLAFALLMLPISRMLTNPLRRLRESALRIAAGELSHRVPLSGGDEVRELSEAMNEMAERVETMVRELREMAANLSHALRTPLARLQLAFGLAEEARSDRERTLQLERARLEIREMDELIGRILLLARAETQQLARQEAIDPRPLVASLIESNRPLFEEQNIVMECSLKEGALVAGSGAELRLAFGAILENQARYAAPGSRVRVDLQAKGDLISIRFLNQCRESRPGDPDQWFEPFFRSPDSPGSGLGLALVRRVIENHGGTATAKLEDDLFELRVFLPALRAEV